MADLFISHSSMDVEWARDLRRQLEAAGYTCWMAPDDVHGPTPWAEQILEAIEGCRVMVVVVSRNANASAHVSKEVGAALEHDKPLLPIRTEAVVPTGSLNYLLQLVQWVDAFPGTAADHLGRIQRAVAYSIPGSSAVPPAVGPAAAAAPLTPVWSLPPVAPPPPAVPVASVAPPAVSTAPVAPPAVGYPSTYSPTATTSGWATTAAPDAAATGRPRISVPLLLAATTGLVAAFVVVAGIVLLGGSHPSPSPGPSSSAPLGFATVAPATSAPAVPPAPSAAPADTASTPPAPSPLPTTGPTSPVLTTAEVSALVPTQVGNVVLAVKTQTGETLLGEDPTSLQFASFLARHGKSPRDFIGVDAGDDTGTSDLQIFAFYVAGVDPTDLEGVLIDSVNASVGTTNTSTTVIDGHQVTQLRGPQYTDYVYVADGIVFTIQTAQPALAEQAIARTPLGAQP